MHNDICNLMVSPSHTRLIPCDFRHIIQNHNLLPEELMDTFYAGRQCWDETESDYKATPPGNQCLCLVLGLKLLPTENLGPSKPMLDLIKIF